MRARAICLLSDLLLMMGWCQRAEADGGTICLACTKCGYQITVFAAPTPLYLFWDAQHYTRNLIDKTELYELLAICWEVGMKSSIHNHKGQNCWMAAPLGKLAVHNYRVLNEDLAAHCCNIVPTDVVDITPHSPVAVDPLNPVHDVRNPREWNQRAVSLHVYSRPFDSCVVYSVEKGTCGEIGLGYTSKYGQACA